MKYRALIITFLFAPLLSCSTPKQASEDSWANTASKNPEKHSQTMFFNFKHQNKVYAIPIPQSASTQLEICVNNKNNWSAKECITLVSPPMGWFSICGKSYIWSGYASLTPEDDDTKIIHLPKQFNLTPEEFEDVINSTGNPQKLKKIYSAFFNTFKLTDLPSQQSRIPLLSAPESAS